MRRRSRGFASRGRNVRIVLADDAAVLRALFVRIAAGLGHQVVAEADRADALFAMLDGIVADALVVDGRLPPSGAPEVVARVRAARRDLRVFVVAALEETSLVRAALAAGAAGIVVRPFVAERVAASLNGATAPPR